MLRLSKVMNKTNIIILNFFGTWCPPCRKEIPDFVKTSEIYEDKKVKFIGILFERDFNQPAIENFIKHYKIDYPILIADKKVLSDYKIRAFPTTFLIDEKGIIVKKKIGLMTEKDLKELLDRYIKLRKLDSKNAGKKKNSKKTKSK